MMLYTTFELITLATSNSHIIFCFCNFIIAVLFVANNNSSSREGGGQESGRENNGIIDYSHPSPAAHIKTAGESVSVSISIDKDSASYDCGDDRSSVYRVNSKEVKKDSPGCEQSSFCSLAIEQDSLGGHHGNDLISERRIPEEVEHDSSDSCCSDRQHDESFSAYQGSLPGCTEEVKAEVLDEAEALREEEDQDDELRQRIEDFIDKMNRGWQYEKLRTTAARY